MAGIGGTADVQSHRWPDPAVRYLVKRAARAVVRRPWSVLRSPRQLRRWLRRTLAEAYIPPLDEQYEAWLARRPLTPEVQRRMEEDCERLAYRPVMSVVTPLHNTPERWLRAAVESVRSQIYPHWELCLADDASTQPHVSRVLSDYSRIDGRIRVVSLPRNLGIAGASNEALALATGDFVGLMDHDDELRPDALLEVVRLLNEQADLDIVYTDEDKKTLDGRRISPFFKPDWSPNLLLSCNYVGHFTVYRRSLLQDVGGFRSAFDGSQDYDVILRASERTSRIGHAPAPLYSWRMVSGSAAASERAKPYAYDAAVRALEEALRRRNQTGHVELTDAPGRYHVRPFLPASASVSIVVPTRDKAGLLRRCLSSVRARTSYAGYEVVVVDSAPNEPLPEDLRATVTHLVQYDRDGFNFSHAVNLGARAASGDYLLLLNDDTEVVSGDWMQALLQHAQRPEIGAVGARLLGRDGQPRHEGIVLGMSGRLAANISFPLWGLSDCLRDCSAVTAACLMTRREVFEQLGGFDEKLELAWNDVDYCLRARQAGYAVVYTPLAVLYHDEGSSRGEVRHPRDDWHFQERWGGPGELADPYYNGNFDRERGPFVLGR